MRRRRTGWSSRSKFSRGFCAEPSLAGWDGLGLAVQAYQKRAPAVIDWLAEASAASGRRLMVRLVKGAYWDTEIKRAQERGLPDFPVFTRKPATDLCYLACARRLLAARPRLYPQFATHNALTVAAIVEMAAATEGPSSSSACTAWARRFMRKCTRAKAIDCRIYAPVGSHKELLAYLVRRLLENGANSSFVNAVNDQPCRSRACSSRRRRALPAARRAMPASRCPKASSARAGIRAGMEFGSRADSARRWSAGVAAAPAVASRSPDASLSKRRTAAVDSGGRRRSRVGGDAGRRARGDP